MRALERGRVRDVGLGTLFAVTAFGVRQFGLLLTLAYAVTVAIEWRRRGKRVTRGQVLACVLPWLACGLVVLYGRITSGTSYPWTVIMRGVPLVIRALLAFRYAFVALLYFGLFLLPLSLPRMGLLVTRRDAWTRRQWKWFGLSAVLIDVLACVGWILPLPNLPNMLRHVGTGPLTLRDTYTQAAACLTGPTNAAWWLLTFLSIASAAILVTDLVSRHVPRALQNTAKPAAGQTLFLILWAVLLTAAPCNPFLPVMFDRYLLSALVPVCVLFAAGSVFERRRGARAWAIGLCLLAYVYSVACAQDYLAWNRARWAAIDRLVTDYQADPLEIDGGFEYNGMHTSDAYMAQNSTTDFNDMGPLGWWILDDTYAVSFRPREGYEELGQAHYYSFLGMEQRVVRMLRRVPGLTPP